MYKIGFDIGGTKIESIVWDGKKIKSTFNTRTPKTKKEFIAILKKVARKFSEKDESIDGIGIGIAGIISGNRVVFSPNIPYLKNFNFKDIFAGIAIKVDNDARAFLRGELEKLKIHNRKKRILAITIGTGIGRAFAEDGQVKKIKKFEYPEQWEKEYQLIRDKKDTAKLIEFLSNKLTVIVKRYQPAIVIISGGILKRRNFFQHLKGNLDKKNKEAKIKTEVQELRLEYLAPLGAALSIK